MGSSTTMKLVPLVCLGLLWPGVLATGPVPVAMSGLAGVNGFIFYNPYCAHACFRSFAAFELPCSSSISAGGHTTAGSTAHSLALCRASSDPFLTSIAWCIHNYCPDDVRASNIETFWETEITGDVAVLPERSYGEVLANISQPPTMVAMGEDMILNTTMLTTDENFEVTETTLEYFFNETARESYYGLAICLTAFALPIFLTWVKYLPWMTRAMDRIKPLLYPSLIGTRHDQPLPYLLGNVPTIGQSAYITVLIILNIVFLAVGYETLYPARTFQWYENYYQELLAYFMWRTGVLAFCQMPVLFLFSTRNNLLLWLTNWSHSTYLLLHRWVARLFLFQTLLHSIISLVLYVNDGSYATTLTTAWWIWGCVATVAAVILVLTSALIFRQRAYELFLITHIVMAVICVVGCWYHVYIQDENCFGYETWLYATIAVWFFDRLARMARVLRTGFRRATLTDIGPNIIRIDVPMIRWASTPGRCVYVFFPTLHPFRPWENHPFSVVSTAMLAKRDYRDQDDSESGGQDKEAMLATHNKTAAKDSLYTNSGITLFVRKTAGMTRYLRAGEGLATLLDGPYPTNPTREVLRSDRLLLIGGGIGITGLVAYLRCHPNPRLLYSIKTADQGLVDALTPVLEEVHEKDIRVDRRLDFDALFRDEANIGWARIAVVVCGPAGMCDDVRAAIARAAKENAGRCAFELQVDRFSL